MRTVDLDLNGYSIEVTGCFWSLSSQGPLDMVSLTVAARGVCDGPACAAPTAAAGNAVDQRTHRSAQHALQTVAAFCCYCVDVLFSESVIWTSRF